MRFRVAAIRFALTFAVAVCLTAQGSAPEVRSRAAAAAGRPRADRARENALRHQLHRLSRRRPPRRRSGRTEPAALAGRAERSGRRIDSCPSFRAAGRTRACPPSTMSPEDGKAVAAYVRSVVETIGRQGMPPSVGQAPPSVLVGDAARRPGILRRQVRQLPLRHGRSAGIATRYPDPKALQNTWVAGRRTRRVARRRAASATESRRTVTVTVTMPSGEKVEGRLVRIDDFLVTVGLADGTCAPSAATATCRRWKSTIR